MPLTALIALLAVLGGGWWLAQTSAVPTDPETLCRTDRPPPAVTLALIDVTSALSRHERVQIEQEMRRLRESVQLHGLFKLYALGGGTEVQLDLLFEACNPGDGSTMNSLYQNPDLARAKWQTRFAEELDHRLDQALAMQDSNESPLLQSLRHLAIAELSDPAYDESDKALSVFSDLLHHDPRWLQPVHERQPRLLCLPAEPCRPVNGGQS